MIILEAIFINGLKLVLPDMWSVHLTDKISILVENKVKFFFFSSFYNLDILLSQYSYIICGTSWSGGTNFSRTIKISSKIIISTIRQGGALVKRIALRVHEASACVWLLDQIRPGALTCHPNTHGYNYNYPFEGGIVVIGYHSVHM